MRLPVNSCFPLSLFEVQHVTSHQSQIETAATFLFVGVVVGCVGGGVGGAGGVVCLWVCVGGGGGCRGGGEGCCVCEGWSVGAGRVLCALGWMVCVCVCVSVCVCVCVCVCLCVCGQKLSFLRALGSGAIENSLIKTWSKSECSFKCISYR